MPDHADLACIDFCVVNKKLFNFFRSYITSMRIVQNRSFALDD